MLPIVAIVGRPNVGKSSLLNRLAGRLISIVDPTPGVTRDRISTLCHHADRYFELVDTGGYGIEDADALTAQVEGQIHEAIERAAIVLFVTDARDGVLGLDRAVADLLRRSAGADRPTDSVILLANKADAPGLDNLAADFFSLGFGPPLAISARHGRGVTELLDRIAAALVGRGLGSPDDPVETAEPEMKLAIVGKRNAGKSTLLNAIAGEQRAIVSEVAGTTRDSVDVRFTRDGHSFLAIDTAGLRKKGRFSSDVEFYSFSRAQRAVRRADVVLLLIDATAPVSAVDKRLGQYISEQFKPTIIVVNKFDLAKGRADSDDYADYLARTMPGLADAPVALTTATEGRNVQSVLDLASQLFKQASTRVPTAQLNAALGRIAAEESGPARLGSGRAKAKIRYGTQVAVRPPTIVLFTHDPQRISSAQQRYLLHRFRELLPFAEVPIRLLIRGREGRAAPGGQAAAKLSRRAKARARDGGRRRPTSAPRRPRRRRR